MYMAYKTMCKKLFFLECKYFNSFYFKHNILHFMKKLHKISFICYYKVT